MPPVYPTLAVAAAVAVVLAELRFFRSGLFREPAYWLSMLVVFATVYRRILKTQGDYF